MDKWNNDDMDILAELGGNKGNHKFWNPKHEPFPFDGDDDKSIVEHFIRDKYILGKFRYDEVKPEDFGERDERDSRSRSRYDDDYGSYDNRDAYDDYHGGSNRHHPHDSRHGRFKYSRQLNELRDMGYSTDTQRIKDALERTHGDINRSLDIIERSDSSSYSSRNESRSGMSSAPTSAPSAVSNPPLPKRKSTLSGPQPAVFDGLDSVMTGAPNAVTGAVPGGIQQYLDPATGTIYVDQQQYTTAVQQQQLQLQAQAQAQLQIQPQMAVYQTQMPSFYYNGIEITPNNPQYQQLLLMQQQQAPQQFQSGFYPQ